MEIIDTLKKGDKGAAVLQLQKDLNAKRTSKPFYIVGGSQIEEDGDFGSITSNALKLFQKSFCPENITGEYDPQTQAAMHPDKLQCAIYYPLKPTQYRTKFISSKFGVTLHHTAGGGNPFRVVDVWNDDDRGRVATHFVVGADGTILQCIPLQFWGHHILMQRVGMNNDNQINSQYIGIEICNYGYVDKIGSKFFNWLGHEMKAEEVEEIEKPFMGKKYWHKYTPQQVASVRLLLAELKAKYGFYYEDLPLNADWLQMDKAAQTRQRVLTTHTNFEGKNKADCSPQKAFFEMIKP